MIQHQRWTRGWRQLLLGLMLALAGVTPAGAQTERPYHIVVLGDSIMWGVGLPEEWKFSTLVQQWLQEQLGGRPVTRRILAHSGAVIRPQDGDAEPALPGEVGRRTPTITAQVSLVPEAERENADLVLVNGGINDVGVLEVILNPGVEGGTEGVRRLARERVREPMKELLLLIGREFPRATVLLPGYYPIVSRQTPLTEVRHAIDAADPTACAQPALCNLLLPAIHDRLIRQSDAWWEEATASLEWAVAEANRVLETTRFQFVPVPFGPEHAYGTADTYLWRIGGEDPLAAMRAAACQEAGRSDIYCRWASTGHPNRKGAEVYGEALISRLQKLVPGERSDSGSQ